MPELTKLETMLSASLQAADDLQSGRLTLRQPMQEPLQTAPGIICLCNHIQRNKREIYALKLYYCDIWPGGLCLGELRGKYRPKKGHGMQIAETVTFGGSGLDRAAEMRNQPDQLASLRIDPQTRVLPFWRGKPLIGGEARDQLVHLGPGHLLLAEAGPATPVFLGFDSERACFAIDVSAWEPPALDAALLGSFLDPTEQYHPSLPADQRFAELRGVMARLSPRDAELAATAKAILTWHETHRFCARCGQPSRVTHAGWQRTCPACGGTHFPRTDPVVIMLVTAGNAVLLGRAPGWPAGMYSLLAGFVEPGETIEAAVRREVAEETGVRVGAVRYLASQPWPFPANLMIGCQADATSRDITLDPAELEDALWLSREAVLQVMAGEHPVVKPTRRGAIAHFLLSNWLADRLD